MYIGLVYLLPFRVRSSSFDVLYLCKKRKDDKQSIYIPTFQSACAHGDRRLPVPFEHCSTRSGSSLSFVEPLSSLQAIDTVGAQSNERMNHRSPVYCAVTIRRLMICGHHRERPIIPRTVSPSSMRTMERASRVVCFRAIRSFRFSTDQHAQPFIGHHIRLRGLPQRCFLTEINGSSQSGREHVYQYTRG